MSDEWKHENLLQIGDSKAMMKQVMREQLLKTMVAAMSNDPNIMGQMIQRIMGQGQPPQVGAGEQPPPGPEGEPTPEQLAMMQQGQPTPEQMAMMAQAGGMEQMPQTGPMIPPAERM